MNSYNVSLLLSAHTKRHGAAHGRASESESSRSNGSEAKEVSIENILKHYLQNVPRHPQVRPQTVRQLAITIYSTYLV